MWNSLTNIYFLFFHRPFIVFWSMNTFENHLECIWLNKSISHFSSTKKEVSQRYLFSYYETRKKSILVNIELYNVDEQIKNHFYWKRINCLFSYSWYASQDIIFLAFSFCRHVMRTKSYRRNDVALFRPLSRLEKTSFFLFLFMNKLISKKTVIESSQYVKRNNMEQKFGSYLYCLMKGSIVWKVQL